jgi:hypothetical protein
MYFYKTRKKITIISVLARREWKDAAPCPHVSLYPF